MGGVGLGMQDFSLRWKQKSVEHRIVLLQTNPEPITSHRGGDDLPNHINDKGSVCNNFTIFQICNWGGTSWDPLLIL